MTTTPAPRFNDGDTIKLGGKTPGALRMRVLATYKSLTGYWYAVQVTAGVDIGDQFAISDDSAYVLYKKAPVTK